MTRLEKCKCGQLAVVFFRGKWLCKVCQAIEQNSGRVKLNGFILKGKGWPGKDIKGG